MGFLKFLRTVGEAVTLLLAVLFLALAIWGGNIQIKINGLDEIFKKWWCL